MSLTSFCTISSSAINEWQKKKHYSTFNSFFFLFFFYFSFFLFLPGIYIFNVPGDCINFIFLCKLYVINYMSYSSSYNLTPATSRVLIGRHFIFWSPTWPTYCKLPWKCTQVKYKSRQKADFPIVTQPHMVLLDGWVKFCVI